MTTAKAFEKFIVFVGEGRVPFPTNLSQLADAVAKFQAESKKAKDDE